MANELLKCLCCIGQGSSQGQFFKQYLEPIKLNDVSVRTLSRKDDSILMYIKGLAFWIIASEV